METIYLFIILLLATGLPLFLHKWLKEKVMPRPLLMVLEIFMGLAIFFVGLMLPFYLFFNVREYPVITKQIDDQYYFEQAAYGMAWTEPGKHLNFYQKREMWFDKKVGHIQYYWGIGNINAEIKPSNVIGVKRLVLYENNRLVMDTTLNFDNGFDFDFLGPNE